MKLEVGQFARLKSGYICKIININDFREPNMKYGVEANYLKDVMFIGDDDIVKTSYNIIDVLEVGDYVNGYYVSKIWEKDEITHYLNETPIKRKEREIVIQAPSCGGIEILKNEDIKSVITHEQMEQMAYKVGD
jgi:hypothetical protein|nr:MAG TPA_asm: hypothetical protein [Caudoviricetes sp.]